MAWLRVPGCDLAGAGNGYGIGSLFTGWPMGRMIYFYVIHLFFMRCLALPRLLVLLGVWDFAAVVSLGHSTNPAKHMLTVCFLWELSNEIL